MLFDSASCTATELDFFAYEIALWKTSQRCRADLRFNATSGDSLSRQFLAILRIVYELL